MNKADHMEYEIYQKVKESGILIYEHSNWYYILIDENRRMYFGSECGKITVKFTKGKGFYEKQIEKIQFPVRGSKQQQEVIDFFDRHIRLLKRNQNE